VRNVFGGDRFGAGEGGMENMNRKADLDRFYHDLSVLKIKLGGYRYLRECTGKCAWPKLGIYFFFEGAEWREDLSQLRVVRVGTHALTDSSRTTLWSRLRAHRGFTDGRGNHRGSVFRDEVGRAILKLERSQLTSDHYGHIHETWGHGRNAEKSVCLAEVPLERDVSARLGCMPFLWLGVDDAPGRASSRSYLERNTISLLSTFGKPAIDPPSSSWLGLHSEKETIRNSGLWNSDYVRESYDPAFLERLEQFL
jgi:hypothetical protein